MKINQLHK